MTNQKLIKKLVKIGASDAELEWLSDRDSDTMWSDCDTAYFMIWYIYQTRNNANKQVLDTCMGAYTRELDTIGWDNISSSELCSLVRKHFPKCPE